MGNKKSIIVNDMEHCYVCGSSYIEIHHVIYGNANRRLSDKYGLIVPLCHECHCGRSGAHFNKDLDAHLKKLAQMKFEALYGANTRFQEVFGKNYL